ncbi:MAG: transglutaminase family protein [Myxococcaceae bacterium]|nr:transglutaminase family protein [Myxococcaceae bacterium]
MNVLIRVGYDMTYQCPRPTPMVLTLNVHYSRASDLVRPDHLIVTPSIPVTSYRDSFGNWCTRIVAPAGLTRLSSMTLIRDSGMPELVAPWLEQRPVQHLPEDTLLYLLGSRYCETDVLSNTAWQLFGNTPTGWKRVQAICDFVHNHIEFGYQWARSTKTAAEAFHERRGVCRDYAHLAVAFCRAMNIPARSCTGYLGDIGVPAVDAPMDFAGWFEAFLGDDWYPFDARNNAPRIGRVLMARGRDAADVALTTSFGDSALSSFTVYADEVDESLAQAV